MDFVEDEAYLAPSPEDARNGRTFSLPSRRDPLDWFVREPWIKDWCLETFKELVERDERRRAGSRHMQRLTPDELRERMEGAHEHIARYKAFIDLLHALDLLPKLKIVDRTTEPRPVPVDVDMVIDLGNSRTCGLLIEAEPDQLGADITKAVKLQLRDLSHPDRVYSDPFESRIEFARASLRPRPPVAPQRPLRRLRVADDGPGRGRRRPARQPASRQRGGDRPVQP